MLLGVVFLTRVIVDNVSSFLLYPRALHVSLARVLDFSLMVTTNNSTVLKVNSMTEDIFICIFFWSKSSCIWSPDTKIPTYMPTIFLSLFSRLLTCTNPAILMDDKQLTLSLPAFLMLFVFYSHPITK